MGEEEIVVFRLEGVGAFAVPVPVLQNYLVPPAEALADAVAEGSGVGWPDFEPVPIILTGDFLQGHTDRRADLEIDHLGCVGCRSAGPPP